MQLYWHRRTLQPRPNPALSAAFSAAKQDDSRVVPVFVLDDAILSRADGLGVAFMLGSLRNLRDWYRDHGGDIVIQHGAPTDVLVRLGRTIRADQVVWNDDQSQLARERDRAVQRALTRAGLAYTSVPSTQQSATSLPSNLAGNLANPDALGIETKPVPRLSDLGQDEYDTAPLTVGTDSARKHLRALSNGTTYRQSDDTGQDITRYRMALDRA